MMAVGALMLLVACTESAPAGPMAGCAVGEADDAVAGEEPRVGAGLGGVPREAVGEAVTTVGAVRVAPAPTIVAQAGAKAAYQAAVDAAKLPSAPCVMELNGQPTVDTARPGPPKRGQATEAGVMATSASDRRRIVAGAEPPLSHRFEFAEAFKLAQGMPSICA